jgi:organic radical activating enzyme
VNISRWSEKYNGILVDPKVSFNAVEEFKEVFASRTAILYGAGLLGTRIRDVFDKLGIDHVLVDRNAARINVETGLDVKEPSFLEGTLDEDAYVLFASVNKLTVGSVENDFAKLSTPFSGLVSGYDMHVTLQSAMCSVKRCRNENFVLQHCYECSILDNTCPVLSGYLRDKSGFDATAAQGTPNVKMIGYVLGSICSLNCQHCCESIPYLRSSDKSFVPKATVIGDIRKYASACEFITLLEFVGGEPFLHPGMVDILDTALKIKNIGVIHVFTNGTVPPKPELCKALSNPRIVIYISNYSKLLSEHHAKKVAATEQMLKDGNVAFVYGSNDNWYDISSFENVGDDEANLRVRYQSCFLHTCNRLHDGALYRCPHHYGGIALGKLQPQQDIVRIHDFGDDALAGRLDSFSRAEYADACQYCSMPFKATFVPPGTQV